MERNCKIKLQNIYSFIELHGAKNKSYDNVNYH